MTDTARDVVAMALQAAECNALESETVPGYTVLADAAIAAHLQVLRQGGYVVMELAEGDADGVWHIPSCGSDSVFPA